MRPIAGTIKKKKSSKGKASASEADAEATLYTLASPLLQLCNHTGRTKRGPKGNRLYSPMVRLKSEFRKGFSFDHRPMVILDMQCAQPCLLANLSRDYEMLEDCLSDEFYAGIVDNLQVDRKRAKKAYCTFAYDEYRPGTPVGAYMRNRYPRASAYMAEKKSADYRHFSHEMQKAEAKIFVDGVYPRMKGEGIEGLTIHDGLFCRKSDENRVEGLIAEELERNRITAVINKE